MRVESLHPGVTKDDVAANTGFELLMDETIPATEPPRAEELRILRDEVDPYRYIIGR